MDSTCPAASRIAGQMTSDSGILFTPMWQTFKREFNKGHNGPGLRVRHLRTHLSELRPYRRLGHGEGQ
ncbi:hypothetical protein E6P09_09425 [Haloferax mediterranei ATCC 33500]|uniref:Uncharacterized protein n=1 Tax=Haloferax mediterranei (strain ATCC 33500 / DSM 1411 / JCM 8866 / NBRC 14739 / NCIMB 2177 / R-4) TaxID=523841 RepID=I3R436_HALMT|nr:hypothetical protein HFX_1283 [Haloferax mediterranei ATCC 33500]QCQ75476.1 hypothetical protein E6P09_09425 [Haloferax mediterranei ATCC 33500]